MNATQTSVNVARDYLIQMGTAALQNDMTIQYCMPLPMHYLASTEVLAVTECRASNDYLHSGQGLYQWRIGMSSIPIWSLGMVPFKDNFWSIGVQPNNPYNLIEPNPELQAIVSVLSTGPVSFGDAIGYTNISLILSTCRSDGMILKPDKPATVIDKTFLSNGPKGDLWDTFTAFGAYRWHYILVPDLNQPYSLYPVDIESAFPGVVYKFNNSNIIQNFNDNTTLNLPVIIRNITTGYTPFNYFNIAPIFEENGLVLLGEVSKIVPVSHQRLSNLNVTSSGFEVLVLGAAFENVIISSLLSLPLTTVTKTLCQISIAQFATLTCTLKSCTCQ